MCISKQIIGQVIDRKRALQQAKIIKNEYESKGIHCSVILEYRPKGNFYIAYYMPRVVKIHRSDKGGTHIITKTRSDKGGTRTITKRRSDIGKTHAKPKPRNTF